MDLKFKYSEGREEKRATGTSSRVKPRCPKKQRGTKMAVMGWRAGRFR